MRLRRQTITLLDIVADCASMLWLAQCRATYLNGHVHQRPPARRARTYRTQGPLRAFTLLVASCAVPLWFEPTPKPSRALSCLAVTTPGSRGRRGLMPARRTWLAKPPTSHSIPLWPRNYSVKNAPAVRKSSSSMRTRRTRTEHRLFGFRLAGNFLNKHSSHGTARCLFGRSRFLKRNLRPRHNQALEGLWRNASGVIQRPQHLVALLLARASGGVEGRISRRWHSLSALREILRL